MSKQLEMFVLQDANGWVWFKRSMIYYQRTYDNGCIAMCIWYWSDIFNHFGFGPSIRVNSADILAIQRMAWRLNAPSTNQ